VTLDVKKFAAAAAIALGVILVYWSTFQRLIANWSEDANYSHGYLIMPIAAYLVWERRARLTALPVRGSWLAFGVFLVGVGILLAGLLGSELFISRVSLLVVLAGIIGFLFGWAHVRALAFPLLFLLLMIPIPAIIFNRITFPLQLLASQAGEWAISAVNIPVLREGNVLILANTQLEVAQACSGIRSLVSLITLGIVYGYFTDSRAWVRVFIVAATIPVAIVANGARVAGTGMLAHWWGPDAAEGFFHEFSGWIVFLVAFAMILFIQKLIQRFAPDRKTPAVIAPPASSTAPANS